MVLQPVFEVTASDEVKHQYSQLKDALHLPTIPLFFAYFGAFPEYLSYITQQIVINVEDDQFLSTSYETGSTILSLLQVNLKKTPEITDWISRYEHSPSFYYFQEDTKAIFNTNITLALIFIALREALKGWAIAAKQLPRQRTGDSSQQEAKTETLTKEDEFIYDDFISQQDSSHPEFISGSNQMLKPASNQRGEQVQHDNHTLTKQSEQGLEKDLLPEYLFLCRQEFKELLKKPDYLLVRIEAEKMLIQALTSFPHLIFSPINVVLKYTGKYATFPDLLYLLAEHFPTYAVQRMLFSGYMIK